MISTHVIAYCHDLCNPLFCCLPFFLYFISFLTIYFTFKFFLFHQPLTCDWVEPLQTRLLYFLLFLLLLSLFPLFPLVRCYCAILKLNHSVLEYLCQTICASNATIFSLKFWLIFSYLPNFISCLWTMTRQLYILLSLVSIANLSLL